MSLAPTTTLAATINVASGAVAVVEDDVCSLREAIINANNGDQTHADCDAGSGLNDTLELGGGNIHADRCT